MDDVDPRRMDLLIKSLYTDRLDDIEDALDLLETLSLCDRFAFPDVITDMVMDNIADETEFGRNFMVVVAEAHRLKLPAVIDRVLIHLHSALEAFPFDMIKDEIKKELKNLHTQAHCLNHADLVEARMIVFDKLITEMRLEEESVSHSGTEMVHKSSDMHFKELSIFLLEEQQAFLRSQLKK